ncbi:MAG: hypothetical protein IH605_15715 [Burkholderiales bacterium]|nr:hypothetical protein [Burkholderiales bacterium]
MKSIEHAILLNGALAAGAMEQVSAEERMRVERLPFTVRVVRSEEALYKAVAIRQAAYARHVPAFSETLKMPEANDYDEGSIILLAESKLDGSPVGTIRVQSNRYRKLGVEQSVELPARLQHRSMVEATRLGVAEGRVGRVTKLILIKALYLYCLEANIDWVIATARPPLDRQYDGLLLEDLYSGEFIPMRHVNNIPHRVLALDIPGARAKWIEASHPLLDFMCNIQHPDIDLSNADFSSEIHPIPRANSFEWAAVGA